MRGKSTILALMMITIVSAPLAYAEPHDDGSTQTITGTETWSSDSLLDGDLIIANNGILTIDSSIDVGTGSSITVEEGGSLILNGALNSAEPVNRLFMEVFNTTVLEPYFQGLIDSGTLRVNFASEYFTNMEVYVKTNDVSQSWTGEDYLDFNVQFNDAPELVEFSGFLQYQVLVESIQAFDSNGAIYTLGADEWNHNNGVLVLEETNAKFSVSVNGEFTASGATMTGAEIMCSGECHLDNSTLSWSAPINVQSSGALTAETSNINGSRTYEDIIVHDSGEITYDVSTMTGTGGPTDMWIRLLSQRIIETNLKDAPASVHFQGIGYQAKSGDFILDENGAINLDGYNNPETSKYIRMTEWVDGNGDFHEEDGSVIITLNGGNSVWNSNYSITIEPAPKTPSYNANIALPYVVIDSIVPEDTQGTVDKGLGVMLTVSNTGEADVATNIKCYEGNDEADVATMFVSLTVGQTKQVPAVWYANSSGAKSLNCRITVPNFFNTLAEDVTSVTGTDSELVNFKEAEDLEDIPIILYAAIVIVIILGTVIFSRVSAKKLAKQQTADGQSQSKDYDDDGIDDMIESMDENIDSDDGHE